MSALNKTPLNPNFLSRAGFKLVLERAPDLNFFVQNVNIPGLSITPTVHPNPFVHIPISGEHIDYDPLSITFKVDENMINWLSMHYWLRGLGFPDSFKEYLKLYQMNHDLGKGIRSDIKLFILTSHRNPKLEVTFRDAFPIHLSGLEFDSTLSDVDYFESTVSFKYTSYDFFLGPF